MEIVKFFFGMFFVCLFYFYFIPFLLSRRWFDKDEK